jgi:hypothetical protein
MPNRRVNLGLYVAATLALAALLGACAGSSGKSNCDPQTIVVAGRCYWEKERACDAIGCVPPDECVVLEGKPAAVECHKK